MYFCWGGLGWVGCSSSKVNQGRRNNTIKAVVVDKVLVLGFERKQSVPAQQPMLLLLLLLLLRHHHFCASSTSCTHTHAHAHAHTRSHAHAHTHTRTRSTIFLVASRSPVCPNAFATRLNADRDSTTPAERSATYDLHTHTHTHTRECVKIGVCVCVCVCVCV